MRKSFVLATVLMLAVALSGCDQFSFLGDYFPALKKKSVAAAKASDTSTAAMAPDILVRVNKWTLTVSDFNEKLKALKEVLPNYNENDVETKKMILEELIRQELLVQAAVAQGLDKKKTVADAMEEFRKTVLVRELANGIVEPIKVTEADALAFYNDKANEDMLKEPEQWRIREIVVTDEAKAKELLIGLLQGQDFGEVAKANSMAATASQGGDTGFVMEFEDPQVQNAVLTLEPGAMSSVFKGAKGFYIVKLEEKKSGEMPQFETIKKDLTDYLTMDRQQEEVRNYIEGLRSKADIKINEELLK